jgi:hypothetical protein
VVNTDAAGELGKSARDGGTGYEPVIKADKLEKILGFLRHDCEDCDSKARRSVVWGLVVTGMDEYELMPIESD